MGVFSPQDAAFLAQFDFCVCLRLCVWQQPCSETGEAGGGCCRPDQATGLSQHCGFSWRGSLASFHRLQWSPLHCVIIVTFLHCVHVPGDFWRAERGETSEGCLCTDEGQSSQLLGLYTVPQRWSSISPHIKVREGVSCLGENIKVLLNILFLTEEKCGLRSVKWIHSKHFCHGLSGCPMFTLSSGRRWRARAG